MSDSPLPVLPAAAPVLSVPAGEPVEAEAAIVAWRVAAGRVDAFAASDAGRVHLAVADAGELLFHPGDDLRLLLVSAEGARLEAVAPGSPLSGEAVDAWLRHLGTLLAPLATGGDADGDPPSDTLTVTAGGQVLRPKGPVRIAAARLPLWLDAPAMELDLLGMVGFGEGGGPSGGPVPLPPGLWAQARGSASAAALTTSALTATALTGARVVADADPWPGLDRLHRALPALLEALARRDAEDRRQRQAAEAGATALRRNAALRHLATAADGDGGGRTGRRDDGLVGGGGDGDAALERAFGRLLEVAGVAWPGPPPGGARTLAALAASARVRLRPVLLGHRWYERDLGPLLATTVDGEPVVLVPRGRGYGAEHVAEGHRAEGHRAEGHRADGRQVRVTAAVAQTLAPRAHMLYRGLPDRAVGLWGLLRHALQGTGRDVRTIAAAGTAAGLFGAAIPAASGFVFDVAVPEADVDLLVHGALAMLCSALAAFAVGVAHDATLVRLDGRSAANLLPAVWDRLLRLPASFFKDFSAGDLRDRVNGLESVRNLAIDIALSAALGLMIAAFNLVVMVLIDGRLAALAVALIAVLAGATAFTGVVRSRHDRAVARLDGALSSRVFQTLRGMAKLRLAGAEDRAFVGWAGLFAAHRRGAVAARRIGDRFDAFATAFQGLGLTALLAVIALAGDAGLSAGRFIAFLAAFGVLQGAALRMTDAALSLWTVLPRYRRAQPILEALPEDRGGADPGPLAGRIDVSNLVFRYAADVPAVLNGVSFSVEPGEFVAIVGPSGSGKTTLLRLLLGLETPEQGAVFHDRQDLSGLDRSAVRRQMGTVLQDGRLFAGSLLDNIRGARDAGFDECQQAARLAGLSRDLEAMPMGLYTMVTEGGGSLSGGQRQRVMIARALVGRPPVLLLDEATSALDNRTQDTVMKSFASLAATRIVVAHRLSTIVHADRIVVLEDGRVVETGTYEALMARDGVFAALARRQSL